ncbi:MAG: serine--tRNA ligase [Patescibacteria group bacterium]
MLDINFIRENPQKVKEACEKKNIKCDIDAVLELDKKRRELIVKSENLKAEQNKTSKAGPPAQAGHDEAAVNKAKDLKEKFKALEPELKKTETELNNLLLQLPNIPFDNVPVGKDDFGNVIMRQVGKPPKFSFASKDYMEIGKNLDLIDTERAGKVSGSRFGYLKNELPLLEFALINLAIDTLKKEKFIPVIPPVMLKDEMARGTGYFEATDEKEAYFLPEDKLYLAGTSEQPLIAMHANEILNEKDLPLRYIAFSTCFRREAGSYGKDTKGILRVHQFDKLEMVVFSKPEDSKKEHQLLLSIEEKLMKQLALPYQVVNICAGDLGRPAAAKYDIETWMPSENKYRETHSTSNCTDFQARRLNIKYKDKTGKQNFVYTLNGTAIAMPRILIAILENYQQKDGSIKVPKVLQKYCGFKIIK